MKTHEHRDQRPGVTGNAIRIQSVTRFCFLVEKSTAYAKTILSDARFFAPAAPLSTAAWLRWCIRAASLFLL
jgi:hypothetical protein